MSETKTSDAGGLRSLIAGALAEGRGVPAADSATEGAAPPAAAERSGDGGEAQRDPTTGRFVPGEGEGTGAARTAAGEPPPAEGEAGEGTDTRGPAAAGAPAPPATGAPAEVRAPEHWSAADKAKFAGLPAAARGAFLEMYTRMEAGFTPKLQRGAQLERDYGDLDRAIFTPDQRQILTQKGLTPTQIINAWADVERGLDKGTPEFKAQLVGRIIHNYRVDLNAVAQIIMQLRGFSPVVGRDDGAGAAPPAPPAPAPGSAVPPALDPALAERLAALENDSREQRNQRQLAAQNEANARVTAFANEVDGSGNLKHPHFQQLEDRMVALLQAERLLGREPSLEDLYRAAVYADDSTRDQVLASQREAEATRAAEERRAKAARAQRAAVSVNGSPAPGRTTAAEDAGGLSLNPNLF